MRCQKLKKIIFKHKNRIEKMNNVGSALLTVILVVSFLTILATTLLYISGLNFQIKQADYQNKKNFYNSEMALEQIKAELMQDVSEATLLAYEDLMVNYATYQNSGIRTMEYNKYFTERLQEVWTNELGTNDWAHLLDSYHSTSSTLIMDPALDANTDNNWTSGEILVVTPEEGKILIKGIKMQYTDPNSKITTVITTNFEINAPAIDFSAEASNLALNGDTNVQAATKDRVEPLDSVIYTNWTKE